jgi:cytochrome c oxidase assembly factor CtaG
VTFLAASVPPPLTWQRALLGWRVEPLALALVLASAVAYLYGVRRVCRAGRSWPPVRTAAFLGGLGAVAVAVLSGLSAYDDVLFSAHMAQHMLLTMVAPLLLALGGPVTLLLGAAGARGRRATARVLHSVPLVVLTHPALAWVLFVASPFALYFSVLFELSLRNRAVHELMHVHFLVTGLLFCWPLVGVDPAPRRFPDAVRMLYAVLTLPFHAFLGIAIMGSSTLLAGDFYLGLGRSWGGSPIEDQNAGGALLWAAGDLVGLVLVALVLRLWMRHEAHATAREDRRLDREESSDSRIGLGLAGEAAELINRRLPASGARD